MKLSQYALLLLILLVQISCSGRSTSTKSKVRSKKVILVIGDGMGLAHVQAALTVNKGALNMTRAKVCGFSKTSSANRYVTDSGAGATAMGSWD